jgi:3-oxoacyl-[acyl-carrier-protein] synthase-1
MSGMSIIAAGAVTAVGHGGPATFAALRAGIRGARTSMLWDYLGGDYLEVCRPQLHQWWEGRDMLARLVAAPIEECAAAAERLLGPGLQPLPIVLVISPPSRPHRWPHLESLIIEDVEHELSRKLPHGSVIISEGRTGVLRALEHAAELLRSRQHDTCIVAGVESFLRQKLVEHYMLGDNRILTEKNSNGFSLGEAAAAVLVTSRARREGAELLIRGLGRGFDPSGAGGTEEHPARGDGLTAAIRAALKMAQLEHWALDLRISDANGEHWKFKDAVFATGRLERERPVGAPPRRFGFFDHWHPSEFTGEIGAAIGPLLLGWALHAGTERYVHGPRLLLHTSEDNGDRAAIVAEFRTLEGRRSA